uniref:Uncharacterized protein n=1 Tax=Noctiluca scintillans TaxID=2966 RepID=A0A7S1F2S8_NOCSC
MECSDTHKLREDDDANLACLSTLSEGNRRELPELRLGDGGIDIESEEERLLHTFENNWPPSSLRYVILLLRGERELSSTIDSLLFLHKGASDSSVEGDEAT